ncbi:unnamed protein product [Rhizophagus irregularis]|uniref:Uncharacterized protein n=1 Tax=Rhizophagus irregularis TaxID=588596 RepID=A0A915YTF8_9GLOM|nr:unnamed protein product [Rhizophagus irregularis]
MELRHLSIFLVYHVNYVFDIDGTSLPHEIIECLRTWPSDDDIKEAIRVGYNEAIALANYFEINNYNSVSIQQLVARVEFSSDDTNIPEIIDENQNQNLTKQEQDESRIKSEDVIGTAAFEIS